MLRYVFLRFLPRRLVPLLFVVEIYQLFRRWQTRNDAPLGRSRAPGVRTDADGTPRSWSDRKA